MHIRDTHFTFYYIRTKGTLVGVTVISKLNYFMGGLPSNRTSASGAMEIRGNCRVQDSTGSGAVTSFKDTGYQVDKRLQDERNSANHLIVK